MALGEDKANPRSAKVSLVVLPHPAVHSSAPLPTLPVPYPTQMHAGALCQALRRLFPVRELEPFLRSRSVKCALNLGVCKVRQPETSIEWVSLACLHLVGPSAALHWILRQHCFQPLACAWSPAIYTLFHWAPPLQANGTITRHIVFLGDRELCRMAAALCIDESFENGR